MATVIDSLVISMGMDTKGVQSGMAQAQNAIGSGIKKIGAIVGPLLGGLAFKSLLDNFTSTADALGKLSDSLGENIEDVDAWGMAATLAGGSAEAFQSSLQTLNKNLQVAATMGSGPAKKALDAMGISAVDATGKAKKSTDMLLELADAAQTMGAAEFAGLAQKLGLDQGTIMLLQSGREEVEKLVAERKKFAYTKEDAIAAAEFSDSLEVMKRGFTKVASVILREVVPVFTKIATVVSSFFGILVQHKAVMVGVFTVIAGLIGTKVVAAIRAMNLAWMTSPATLVITAIVAAIAGLLLLLEDFSVWMEGGESLLGDFFGPWPQFIGKWKDTFLGAWEKIKSIGASALQWIRQKAADFFDFFAGPIGKLRDHFSGMFDFLTSNGSSGWDIVRTAAGGLFDFIAEYGPRVWDDLTSAVSNFFSYFEGAVEPLKQIFLNVFSLIADLVTGDFGAAVDDALALLQNLGSFIFNVLTGAFRLVFDFARNIFTRLWNWLKGIFSKVGDAILGGIKSAVGWIADKLPNIGPLKAIKEWANSANTKAVSTGENMAEAGADAPLTAGDAVAGEINEDNSTYVEFNQNNTITTPSPEADAIAGAIGDSTDRAVSKSVESGHKSAF